MLSFSIWKWCHLRWTECTCFLTLEMSLWFVHMYMNMNIWSYYFTFLSLNRSIKIVFFFRIGSIWMSFKSKLINILQEIFRQNLHLAPLFANLVYLVYLQIKRMYISPKTLRFIMVKQIRNLSSKALASSIRYYHMTSFVFFVIKPLYCLYLNIYFNVKLS